MFGDFANPHFVKHFNLNSNLNIQFQIIASWLKFAPIFNSKHLLFILDSGKSDHLSDKLKIFNLIIYSFIYYFVFTHSPSYLPSRTYTHTVSLTLTHTRTLCGDKSLPVIVTYLSFIFFLRKIFPTFCINVILSL